MIYKVKYFNPNEFHCRCCFRGGVAEPLILWLDLLRSVFGLPIRINSGFRCAKHNQAVGGSASSRHLAGLAADIAVAGLTPDPADFSTLKLISGRICNNPGWEYITYKTFIHIALPRPKPDEHIKLWDGGEIKI
mgnify:CR=1 FL=1